MSRSPLCAAVVWLLVTATAAAAPQSLAPDLAAVTGPVFAETVSRDGSGDTIVRAIRLTAPFRLDGQLDEGVYRELRPASDFIQEDPDEGAPATERTETWLFVVWNAERDTMAPRFPDLANRSFIVKVNRLLRF